MVRIESISGWKLRLALCLVVCTVTAFGATVKPGVISTSAAKPNDSPTTIGEVKAKGAFTADFALPGSLPLNEVAPLIERDRMYMSARRGMQNKYLPLRIDFATGNLLSGGRYLFDTEHDAEMYKNWVKNDFILDGVHFFDRPIFIDPDYHAWRVIGAHHLGEIDTRIIVRTERWSVSGQNISEMLKSKWNAILAEAGGRGMTSAWLLYDKDEQLVQLVYFADRIAPADPTTPDFASLAALQFSPALGHHFDDQGWTKTFDRTQWVLTIWYPFVTGDNGQPSLWPHSPPLPEPYCGDGVCEVSRGESNATCPGDCPPTAGNGVCEQGENSTNCPGDCPPQ
jgi:hypothetical protein